ncbi:MAG: Ribosomal large subunit methyltransferase, partial [Pseudomonadota bacterium]
MLVPPLVELSKDLGRHLRAGHPWVFRKAIANLPRSLPAGTIVDLVEHGSFVARGYLDPHSPITVRVLTRNPSERVDAAFWRARTAQAVAARRMLFDDSEVNAYRVINGEGDFLPGVVADRYGDFVVLKLYSAGLKAHRTAIVHSLMDHLPIRGVWGRDEVDQEGDDGASSGGQVLAGEAPPELITIRERGVKLLVDVRRGQKTGLFLDQRENRAAVRKWSKGRRVLNCYAFTGGFSVQAALGGATQVVSVDQDADAMALAADIFEANGLKRSDHDFITGDVSNYLSSARREGAGFGLIVLDPPAFTKSQKTVESAQEGYASINRAALQLLEPGGILVTASCSARVTEQEFFQAVKEGAFKAKADVQLLETHLQPADHPVQLQLPEGR